MLLRALRLAAPRSLPRAALRARRPHSTDAHDLKAAWPAREVVFMAGLPGAGKSRVILERFGAPGSNEPACVVLDLDHEMRSHPEYDDADPESRARVYARADAYSWADARVESRFQACLRDARVATVVVDGTGTKVKRRLRRLGDARAAGFATRILYVRVGLETALARNELRSRRVPADVLEAYGRRLDDALAIEAPHVDAIEVVENDAHDGRNGRARWGATRYDAYNATLAPAATAYLAGAEWEWEEPTTELWRHPAKA